MKKSRIFLKGLYQSLGLVAYVVMIVFVMNWISRAFQTNTGNNPIFITIFLLIFVLSALISGSITLAYPIILFTRKLYKEAWWVLIFTVLCLIFYLLIFLVISLFIYY